MKTAHKIAFARAAYLSIRSARKLFGKDDHAIISRAGLTYHLDLAQGIDLAIFLFGSFEPTTRRALQRHVKPGMIALDIGANIGAHTLRLGQLVGPSGRVLAFEPTAFAFQKLRRNVELNPQIQSRIECFQQFLTSGCSVQVPRAIYSSWPMMGGKHLHPQHLGEEMNTVGVLSSSLDAVLERADVGKVDIVKMDVDGFECDVLSGASRMMARDHPTFVMELAPYVHAERGYSFERFLDYFLAQNYHFYDERSEKLLPREPNRLIEVIGKGAGINVVARVG
jgi:FkbM family methyltransferase